MLYGLKEEDVARLRRLLNAWESGRLNQQPPPVPSKTPGRIMGYFAKAQGTITAASGDEPGQGEGNLVRFVPADGEFVDVELVETIYNTSEEAIEADTIIQVSREPYSGKLFATASASGGGTTTGPAFSGARIFLTGTQTVGTLGSEVIEFDDEVFDTDDYFDVGFPGRLYTPTGGKYHFGFNLTLSAHLASEVFVRLNGDDDFLLSSAAWSSSTGTVNPMVSCASIYELEAGDYLEVRFDNLSTLGSQDVGLGLRLCDAYFWIYRLEQYLPPDVDFSGTPTSGEDLEVVFTDESTGSPTSWLWEKDDGSGWTTFSTSQNPTESFDPGVWDIRLTATNAGGSASKTREGYITAEGAVSSGPNSPTSAANTSAGDQSWSDVSNALTSNNSYATCALGSDGAVSDFLDLSGFGFAIPSGAAITGIVVELERADAEAGDGSIQDASVKLLKAGSPVGADRVLLDSLSAWPTSDTYQSYGSSSDSWGVAWTPAEVNASGFGLRLQVTATSDAETARVDHARVTVHWALGGSYSVPVADFSGTPTTGVVSASVAFTDSSTGTPTAWLWEFNSGGGWEVFSTVQNPTLNFSTGVYSVRLTASNALGSDTETKTNYVTIVTSLTAGPLSPGSASSIDQGSTPNWSSPGNITSADGSEATTTVSTSPWSDQLAATNFGFSIPAGSNIKGIVAEYKRRVTAGSVGSVIYLVKDGTTLAGDQYFDDSTFPGTAAYFTKGTGTFLWGTTWTYSEVNASTFGLVIQAFGNAGGTNTAAVDHARLSVYYRPPVWSEWRSPASTASVDDGGTPNWSSTGNITAEDGSEATCTLSYDESADCLTGTNFGFDIPGGATVVGVEVEYKRRVTTGAGNSVIYLTKNGTSKVGSDTDVSWPGTATTVTFGGVTDTLGASLTASEVNASTFGVMVQFVGDGGIATNIGAVDYIRARISYAR